jgi:hypothetical protein
VKLCSSSPKLMWWRSSPAARTKLTLSTRESAGICSLMNHPALRSSAGANEEPPRAS